MNNCYAQIQKCRTIVLLFNRFSYEHQPIYRFYVIWRVDNEEKIYNVPDSMPLMTARLYAAGGFSFGWI